MSIQAVAAKAGVSVATVSRAFNFPDKVTPATRELVERVARELNYLPNASARTLRTQRSFPSPRATDSTKKSALSTCSWRATSTD
jgi:DNA-binding LacI/PurR family transcriptional regulator